MNRSAALKEVTDRCLAAGAKLAKAKALKDFSHYNLGQRPKLRCIGLPVPIQRALFREKYSFHTADHADQLKIWDHIWRKSCYMEVMNQALFAYHARRKAEILLNAWPVLRGWIERIGNWAHSDSLSATYAQLLELDKRRICPQLREWNNADNPWKRRISIVSLLYFSASREQVLPFRELLPMVKNLLKDEDYYVQKGVGWTLREIGNVYPQETLCFLTKHIDEIDPLAFSAALEKRTQREKARLKKLRSIAGN